MPLVVALVVASRCNAYDVLLQWTVPPEPDVIGYRVFRGSASGTYGLQTDVALPQNATLAGVVYELYSGLTLGTTYYFAVTAYNSSGLESDYSNEKVIAFNSVTPPRADAGPDVAGVIGDLLTLGSAPDPGVNYFWEQTAGALVSLSSRTDSRTECTAAAAGTYQFALTAYDAQGVAARDFVSVIVTDPSTPTPIRTPTIGATPTRTRTPTPTLSGPTRTPTVSPTPLSGSVRLYLTSLAPSYLPALAHGAWSNPPGTRLLWSPTTGGAFSNALRLEVSGKTTDVGLLWAISDPIASAILPAGSKVNWGIEAAEQSVDANLFWHVHLYVLAGSTDTVRCTLLSNYREDVTSSNEWPVSPVGMKPRPNPPALTPCAAQPGDRLAVEIGYVARNTLTTSRYGFVDFGTTGADVTVGVSGGAPWVELTGVAVQFQGQVTPTFTALKSATPTSTPAPILTATPRPTASVTATGVAAPSPTRTRTPSVTAAPAATSTRTPSPTATVALATATRTMSPTPTASPAPRSGSVRLYLTSLAPNDAPMVTHGEWVNPPSAQVLWSPAKGGGFSNALRLEASGGAADVGLLWAVSEPLTVGEFPADSTVDWGIEAAQQSEDANLFWHVHLYVLAGSTDTVRCTLLADYREDGGSNNEWPLSPVGMSPQPNPPTLTPCVAAPGDRLAVEIGYVARNTLSAPRYGFMNYGTTGPDVTVGGSGGAPWVELIGVGVEFQGQVTPSFTPSASATPTPPPVLTATPAATSTAVAAPSPTPTDTPSNTATPAATLTETPSATATVALAVATLTATATPTASPTPSSEGVRLYLTSLAPSYAPTLAQGTWVNPPSVQVSWSPTKGGAFSDALRLEAFGGPVDIGLLWAISEPMSVGDFPPGSVVDWGIEAAQQAVDGNFFWHVHLYVLAGSTDTVRCTLLSDYREDGRSNNEWPVSPVGMRPQPAAPALTPCAAEPGDRLAIEIGFVARNTLATPRYGFINHGTTGPDVSPGDTGGAAWIALIGARVEF